MAAFLSVTIDLASSTCYLKKICLSKNSNRLSLPNKLLGLQMFAALFFSGKSPDILVPDYEESCVLRHIFRHVTSGTGSNIRCFATRAG